MVLSNCMNWDLAPNCVCGPNFASDSIGESPILSAAMNDDPRKIKIGGKPEKG